MFKLAVAVLAVAFAGTVSAAQWKDLRIDGSSEAAFQQSMAIFKEKLSPERRYAFQEALMDIWIQGATSAESNQREYTVSDYYQRLHGLGYEEVVTLTDPTGQTAKTREREATRSQVASSGRRMSPWQNRYYANERARAERANATMAPPMGAPTAGQTPRR